MLPGWRWRDGGNEGLFSWMHMLIKVGFIPVPLPLHLHLHPFLPPLLLQYSKVKADLVWRKWLWWNVIYNSLVIQARTDPANQTPVHCAVLTRHKKKRKQFTIYRLLYPHAHSIRTFCTPSIVERRPDQWLPRSHRIFVGEGASVLSDVKAT